MRTLVIGSIFVSLFILVACSGEEDGIYDQGVSIEKPTTEASPSVNGN